LTPTDEALKALKEAQRVIKEHEMDDDCPRPVKGAVNRIINDAIARLETQGASVSTTSLDEESAWRELRPDLEGPTPWTTGEVITYRGFFRWGWQKSRLAQATEGQNTGKQIGWASRQGGNLFFYTIQNRPGNAVETFPVYDAPQVPVVSREGIGNGLREAFMHGAKWWEFHSTKGTMWQSDQKLVAEAAERRYHGTGHLPQPDRETAQSKIDAAVEALKSILNQHDTPYVQREVAREALAALKESK